MKLSQINVRDPFVLPAGGTYYLYGTIGGTRRGDTIEFPVYTSDDLSDWEETKMTLDFSNGFWADSEFWAPDVFFWRGRYYLFLSCTAEGRKRGTHVFASDSPTGVYKPVSSDPITPRDSQCLDATLYVEDGIPYLLYSREWLEVGNGRIVLSRLNDDLTERLDEGVEILDARSSGISNAITGTYCGEKVSGYVTDSPLLYKTKEGKYLLLWSTFADNGYAIAVASSDSLKGRYRHEKLLFDRDGGHAMLFDTFEGERKISFHVPNSPPEERPCFYTVTEKENMLEI